MTRRTTATVTDDFHDSASLPTLAAPAPSRIFPKTAAAATPPPVAPSAHTRSVFSATISNSVSRIVTPLDADAWEQELSSAGVLASFASIPSGLREGFDVGLDRDTTFAKFSDSHRYQLYNNHKHALENPRVIDDMIKEETAEGRISQFYTPDELFRLVGPFRNAPLTVAPKNGDYALGRVCQDFSYPRDDPQDVSFNASLDMQEFTCDWGTFAQCYMLAARAPPQAQVAVFDVKAAHRRVPVSPWQQPFYAIAWMGLVALNFCCQFGAASSSGLWGRLADAFRAIFLFHHPSADCINWADDFTFWRYPRDGKYDLTEDDVYALADRLGWPWSKKKTRPFSARFNYLGFTWDLDGKTVEVTTEKKSKYLSELKRWQPGASFRQKEAQSVLGKLVHCCLVVPEGRSRIPRLSRWSSTFRANRPHLAYIVPAGVLEDIAWWRNKLEGDFCGMPVRTIPDPVDVDVFVDASTGWGIGVTINRDWDHWRLRAGWKTDGRDIGWAEMVAVELGLLALVERGYRNAHIRLRSDNQGVVGALDAGRSRGVPSNRVLQRVVAIMLEHDIWLSVVWVASADNPADAPSRGIPAPGFTRRAHAFNIPFAIRDLVDKV